jgi:hypothetical protein
VFRVEKDAADSTIVLATVNLAHDLGLRVVAEGVENDPGSARCPAPEAGRPTRASNVGFGAMKARHR